MNKNPEKTGKEEKKNKPPLHAVIKVYDLMRRHKKQIGAVIASPILVDIGLEIAEHRPMPNVHRTHIEREVNDTKLLTRPWLKNIEMPDNPRITIFIHAGGNSKVNLPLTLSLIEACNQQSQDYEVEFRIDYHMVTSACASLGIEPLSIEEFNTQKPEAVIQTILQKRYPDLDNFLAHSPANIKFMAQGDGNSYTEAEDFIQNLPDIPNQIVITPAALEDTGTRSAMAMNEHNQERQFPADIHVLDFDEEPGITAQEWLMERISLRMAQLGVKILPKPMRKFKYDVVKDTKPKKDTNKNPKTTLGI